MRIVSFTEEDKLDEKYPKFGSIPRRYRGITITEKLDGTNGLIRIRNVGSEEDGDIFVIRAGSRNKWLVIGDDNYGFAGWVERNKETLIADLGEGDHYGEWWGAGIQRRYGLLGTDKRFSLFNSNRWAERESTFTTPNLFSVPVLAQDVPNTDKEISIALGILRSEGSKASPGYMNPEGIVIWDDAARINQKVTLENDEKPKSKVSE